MTLKIADRYLNIRPEAAKDDQTFKAGTLDHFSLNLVCGDSVKVCFYQMPLPEQPPIFIHLVAKQEEVKQVFKKFSDGIIHLNGIYTYMKSASV